MFYLIFIKYPSYPHQVSLTILNKQTQILKSNSNHYLSFF